MENEETKEKSLDENFQKINRSMEKGRTPFTISLVDLQERITQPVSRVSIL